MKVFALSVESTKRTLEKKDKSGTFTIDTTQLVIVVPFKTKDEYTTAFGVKEMKYQVGSVDSSTNYHKLNLAAFEDMLPCEVDIELGQGTNSWGQPVTCVIAVSLVD